MAKYIDAGELIKLIALTDLFKSIDDFIDTNNSEIVRIIESMPAADVEPVRHGKWIGDIYPYCSVCGETSDYCDGTHKRSKRCPNCGAKMDVE